MCGINGYLYTGNISKNEIKNKINSMNNEIVHRGPDDEGIFMELNENYSLALGMRRLSIIDLSNGTQPIYSEDKNIDLLFEQIYLETSALNQYLWTYIFVNDGSEDSSLVKLKQLSSKHKFVKII